MDEDRLAATDEAGSGPALETARALSLGMDEAWNARDAAAMASLFEPEGDFTFHNGIHVRGREAVARFWSERVFPRTPETLRHLGTVKSARFVTDDVLFATANLRIYDASIAPDPDGEIPTEAIHLQTEAIGIGVRAEGRWRFSIIQLWVPERDRE